MNAELIWPAALSLLLVLGPVSDIRDRRLPNWLSLALLLLGLAYGYSQGSFATLGWHGAHAAIALVVGMALFAAGIIGGGDAKFYAGLAAYFPLGQGLTLLLWVSLTAIVAIIIWLGMRRILRSSPIDKESLHAKFPYGVAITGGGLWVAWSSFLAA
ncbi:MAG: hypothetical protein APF78_05755 [Sphingomonadales bacterium BRH_c3]|nr:MAG: hypothetical protein APF78_05755 [Sphingomonadales bacterium BRH_c3]